MYGVLTAGGPDRSFTVGGGYGFAGTDLARKPVLMIGGESRVSDGLALVTENWVVPGEPPVLSAGCRLIGERFTADFALVSATAANPVVFPYIDLVYSFGR